MKRLFSLLCFSALIVFSCKKNKDDAPPKEYPYYFTASIDGINFNYQANDSDAKYSSEIAQQQNSAGSDYDIYEGTVIMDKETIPSNAIYVYILKHFNHDPGSTECVAMVHTGSYPYGVANLGSTVDGVSIRFTDADGNLWNSEVGSQAGSSFNVTEVIDNPARNSAKLFKAAFSCKIYNGLGSSRQITNATIRGKILSP